MPPCLLIRDLPVLRKPSMACWEVWELVWMGGGGTAAGSSPSSCWWALLSTCCCPALRWEPTGGLSEVHLNTDMGNSPSGCAVLFSFCPGVCRWGVPLALLCTSTQVPRLALVEKRHRDLKMCVAAHLVLLLLIRGLRQLEIYFGSLFNDVTSASGMPLSKVVKGAERRNIWWWNTAGQRCLTRAHRALWRSEFTNLFWKIIYSRAVIVPSEVVCLFPF